MKTKTAEWTYSYGYYSTNVLRELNDGFTVTDTGCCTVLVTTQSRDTIRILLYVEQ